MSKTIRDTRTARTTGLTYEFLDLSVKGAPKKGARLAGGDRHATRCVEHGIIVGHRTWHIANFALSNPEVWCEGCGTDAELVGKVQAGELSAREAVRGTDDHAVRLTGTEFTKGETLRRLRTLSTEARRVTGLPRNVRVEVGLRTRPVAVDHLPTGDEAFPEGDDLDTPVAMADARTEEQVRAFGAVVHLYLSTTGDSGELVDVVTGWMGTADADPALLHSGTGGFHATGDGAAAPSLDDMNRDELRELARDRGVKTSGTKADLIARLSA